MIEFLKQPAVVAAIITLIGAAIIAPLVKKFYFDVRSRLRVEVRAWKNKTSEALKSTVEGTLDRARFFDDPMRVLIRAQGYATVTITNISKKKILGISVTFPDSLADMVCQIDDVEEIIAVKEGQPIGLGDIQPKHSRVIHIWSNVDMSEFHFVWFKRLLWISADELDSVRLRFPTPRYLRIKYVNRFSLPISLLCLTASFVYFYLVVVR